MIKQLVSRGLFAGFVLALTASCGSGEGDPESNPSTPTAGNAGSKVPLAGSLASAGSPAAGSQAVGGAGAGGSTGTSTSGVSNAGASAAAANAAGASGATGGAGVVGSVVAAGSNAAVGKGGSGAAGANAAAAGCGSESFAAIYESILKNTTYNCAGPLCHGRDAASAMTVGNLSLSSAPVAYAQLVKVSSTSTACTSMPRVVPGDPAGSLLVQKLRSATTTCGGVMPVGADEITDIDLKRLTDWISGGACDN